jgi:integrase
MARVNILKRIKIDGRWKMVSIPRRKDTDNYDWKSLPDGRYLIEWYERGKRRREAAGVTAAEALDAVRRKKHQLEGKALGIAGETEEEEPKRRPLHLAVKRYLDVVDALKKPNTLRKYRAVLERFSEFFTPQTTPQAITPDDLNQFMVHLKTKYKHDNNTVIHNMVIVAQFLKKHGRAGLTRQIDLPEKITALPQDYSDAELNSFFEACTPDEYTLFLTFLLTGFREQEVVHLAWDDINSSLDTIKVTAKPDLGFYPKRWEDREVPVPKHLIERLKSHPHHRTSRLVFPSPPGNRDLHMLDKCKDVAERAGLDTDKFDLKTFRSTYATRMLRAGFDPRTVQHWMGHKSLETTTRYLSPAKDVHDRLNKVEIAGIVSIAPHRTDT